MARKRSKIIYVNYSPYENAGKILDYLLETFETVALFSFNFHQLGKKSNQNKLSVYFNGRKIDSKNLFNFQVLERHVFLLLPIRSLLNFIQLTFYTIYLRVKYGKFNYYLTVNAFTSWIGLILKRLKLIDNTIYWVWDYYPLYHKNRIIVFMRWLYWQFDKLSSMSNKLLFLNKRLINIRKRNGILGKNTAYSVISIGTDPIVSSSKNSKKKVKKLKLGFLGVVKKSQGLDLIYDNAENLTRLYPKVELHVLGAGPDLDYFKKKSSNSKITSHFYGYLSDKKLKNVLKECNIGIATYVPSKDNVSYYGDPSKIKQYLSCGLPVITTNVFEFSKEVKTSQAGIIISYYKPKEFVVAINKILKNYTFYSNNAKKLAKKYYYKNLYPEMFTPY